MFLKLFQLPGIPLLIPRCGFKSRSGLTRDHSQTLHQTVWQRSAVFTLMSKWKLCVKFENWCHRVILHFFLSTVTRAPPTVSEIKFGQTNQSVKQLSSLTSQPKYF